MSQISLLWLTVLSCFPSGNKPNQSVMAYCVVLFASGNKPDQFVMAYYVVSFLSGNKPD